MTTLLIDADGVAFRAASAVEKSIGWDDDIHTNHADLNEAIRSFVSLMERIIQGVGHKHRGDDDLVMCFSCPTRTYFRHHILPSYKGNRKNKPPLVLKDLKAYIEEHYRTYTKPHLEADDVLGVLMTNPKIIKGHKVIVTPDKDLDQVPGDHFNPLNGRRYIVEPAGAERWLWMQVLMGDTVDGYSGCPGAGPVKAEAILKGTLETGLPYWKAAHQAFHKAGLSDAEFVQQVNVARMIQHSTYDYAKKEPILWELPSETCSTTAKPATAPTAKSAGSRKPSSERTRTRPTGNTSRTTRRTP